MTRRICTAAGALAILALAACSDKDLPPRIGAGGSSTPEAQTLYQKAKDADTAGDTKKAIKLYKQAADRYPLGADAQQARYRQAELLAQQGETVKAFDAYQEFIERYQGSGLYAKALERQATIAQSAADGEIKTSFLGLKSRLDTQKVVGMLEKIRTNAPASPTASKAQFGIGELYQSRGKGNEAIDAFRKLVRDFPDSREAGEGQYRIGAILLQQSEHGNQNQANINSAREAFLDHLQHYPGHAKNSQARAQLAKLSGLDLQRSFDIAEFHYKKQELGSAKYYYNDVLSHAKTGALADKARARLAEIGNH